jgi:methionine sulfoxide reductase heme-binding subunit
LTAPPRRKPRRRPATLPPGVWWLVLLVGLLPAAWLAARTAGWLGGLGTNPIERLLIESGTIAMIMLLSALAVTPLRRLTGLAAITRLRRMIGLLAFGYVSLHFLIWLGVDLFFDVSLILDDLTQRPYVMVGFAAWVILLLLASTSTDRAVRILKRNWSRLHRLVYAAGVLAVIHVIWLTRADYREATIYALVLLVLLGSRVVWTVVQRRKVRGEPARNGVT